MSPDIWRIPTTLAVMAVAAIALFAGAVGLALIGRRCSRARVAAIAVVGGGLVALSVFAIRATAARVADTLGVSAVFVDPGPPGYAAPVLFAGFLLATASRMLDRTWTGLPAALFYAWAVVFTALNIVNYCSPGWCETIGFPLPWSRWSDAILTFNDEPVSRGQMLAVAIASTLVNLAAFVFVARLLRRCVLSHRRT